MVQTFVSLLRGHLSLKNMSVLRGGVHTSIFLVFFVCFVFSHLIQV